jgi:hypothetical protein
MPISVNQFGSNDYDVSFDSNEKRVLKTEQWMRSLKELCTQDDDSGIMSVKDCVEICAEKGGEKTSSPRVKDAIFAGTIGSAVVVAPLAIFSPGVAVALGAVAFGLSALDSFAKEDETKDIREALDEMFPEASEAGNVILAAPGKLIGGAIGGIYGTVKKGEEFLSKTDNEQAELPDDVPDDISDILSEIQADWYIGS